MDVEPFANQTWHERTPRLWRRIMRGVMLDALILAGLVIAGEAVLRRFLPQYSRFVFTRTLTGGHPQVMNSRGLRDREFPTARPTREIRLVCLGNSTTRGAGVAGQHTYPKQLQAMLNEREPGNPYFVINAGGEGKSLIHALDFVNGDALAFDPSVVVLGFSPSMLAVLAREQALVAGSSTLTGPERPPTAWSRFSWNVHRAGRRALPILHGSYFYVFCNATARYALYWSGILRDPLDRDRGATFAYAFNAPGVVLDKVEASYVILAECLGKMKVLLDEHDVPLIVLGIPSRFRISDQWVDNERGLELSRIRIEPLDRLAALCRELEVPFVNLRVRLRSERAAMLNRTRSWNDLYIPLDYSHLNEQGLRLAAEKLLKTIDSHGWLPQRGHKGD